MHAFPFGPNRTPGIQPIPLVCVPIVAVTPEDILRQATIIAAADPLPDVVEWRVDALSPQWAARIPTLAQQIKPILGDIPLLFTNRQITEGGTPGWDEVSRLASIVAGIHSGAVTLVDIELGTAPHERQRIIAAARAASVFTIVSAHDFRQTPDDATLLATFAALLASEGESAKCVVMAQTPDDALRLLRITDQMAGGAHKPLIGIAMGAAGTITRLAGPFFGVGMTFATIEAVSAPGQLPLALVRAYWRAAGLRP